MTRPVLTIAINNHNYGRFLADAVDSALAQTYSEVEVVVVDDGSTDESSEVIRQYGPSVRAIFQERQGHAAALDTGLGAASGEIVCFLDADDILLPETIER